MASCNTPPLFSVGNEKGRRSTMEDRHDIRTNFMELPLDFTKIQNVIPQQLQTLERESKVHFSKTR